MKKRMLVLGEKWRFTRERMVVLQEKNYMKRTIWIEIDFSAKNGGFTTKTGLTLRMKHGGLTEKNVEFHMIA